MMLTGLSTNWAASRILSQFTLPVAVIAPGAAKSDPFNPRSYP